MLTVMVHGNASYELLSCLRLRKAQSQTRRASAQCRNACMRLVPISSGTQRIPRYALKPSWLLVSLPGSPSRFTLLVRR
jgi:hypothetical protein